MAFVRSIGRWTMTALVINCIIGSGIFAVPGELTRLLGRVSPFAMIFAGIAMAVIMACITEVASQFVEPGGSYLYVRTAFGRFMGMQIGWFHLLAVAAAVAVCANLFMDYLVTFFPWALNRWERSFGMALLIVFGLARFAHHPQMIHASELASPGWSNWVRAIALLIFPLGGWEDSLI